MPVVSGRHNGRQIIVPVIITHPGDATIARSVTARGLVDTGATITAISRDIVVSLDLEPEGKRIITNTHGQARSTQYRFRIGFLEDRRDIPVGLQPSTFPFFLNDLIFGIDIAPTERFDVLIGIDVLSQLDIQISKDRSYRFAF